MCVWWWWWGSSMETILIIALGVKCHNKSEQGWVKQAYVPAAATGRRTKTACICIWCRCQLGAGVSQISWSSLPRKTVDYINPLSWPVLSSSWLHVAAPGLFEVVPPLALDYCVFTRAACSRTAPLRSAACSCCCSNCGRQLITSRQHASLGCAVQARLPSSMIECQERQTALSKKRT